MAEWNGGRRQIETERCLISVMWRPNIASSLVRTGEQARMPLRHGEEILMLASASTSSGMEPKRGETGAGIVS